MSLGFDAESYLGERQSSPWRGPSAAPASPFLDGPVEKRRARKGFYLCHRGVGWLRTSEFKQTTAAKNIFKSLAALHSQEQ